MIIRKTYVYIIILFLFALGTISIVNSQKKKIFPHYTHLENDVECKQCHKSASSTKASDSNFPDGSVCTEECHESDIFGKVEFVRSQPKSKLLFNHEVHVEQELGCTHCHKGLSSSGFKPGTAFPKMSVCFKCHDNETAPKTCTFCHVSKVPFPHAVHVANDLECLGCHKEMPKSSVTVRGKDVPKETLCAEECHEAEDKHADVIKFDIVKDAKNIRVTFNHEVHIEQELKCTLCHKGLEKEGIGPGDAFPKMSVCFKCHDNDTAPKTCSLCHKKEKVYFPHKLHLENDLGCEECHTDIKKSVTTDGGNDIPNDKVCDNCHEAKDKFGEVVKFPYKQTYQFNHKFHIEEQDLSCKDCHSALYTLNKITDQSKIVPKMDYCFECHDNSTATQYCMLCHLNPTKPNDHYYDWDNTHRRKANIDIQDCTSCHGNKAFCLNCHKGIKKPAKSHNSNFEVTHKYESRTSLKNCKACHSQKQCRSCHISMSISKGSATRYKTVHPSGWTNQSSPNFHKRKAKLRISACTGCHTKRDCIGCHNTTGGVGPRKK